MYGRAVVICMAARLAAAECRLLCTRPRSRADVVALGAVQAAFVEEEVKQEVQAAVEATLAVRAGRS